MEYIKSTKVSTFDPSEEDYRESGTPAEKAYAESVSGSTVREIFGEDEDDEESESEPDDEAAELSEPDAEKRAAALRGQPSIQTSDAIKYAHEWEAKVAAAFGAVREGTIVVNGKSVWSPADIRFDDGIHLGEVKVIGAMEQVGTRQHGTTNGKVHIRPESRARKIKYAKEQGRVGATIAVDVRGNNGRGGQPVFYVWRGYGAFGFHRNDLKGGWQWSPRSTSRRCYSIEDAVTKLKMLAAEGVLDSSSD